MNEIWKDVPGYEGHYQVSSLGRVRSLDRHIEKRSRWGTTYSLFYPGKQLVLGRNAAGYLHITLYLAREQKSFLIHRLVASVFIGGESPDLTVNHKDGDKSNNAVSNLEWMTQRDNNRHARTALPFKQHRHAVRARKRDGSYLYFESKKAAEEALLGKATGIVSWVMKNKRPALGMAWEPVCE